MNLLYREQIRQGWGEVGGEAAGKQGNTKDETRDTATSSSYTYCTDVNTHKYARE